MCVCIYIYIYIYIWFHNSVISIQSYSNHISYNTNDALKYVKFCIQTRCDSRIFLLFIMELKSRVKCGVHSGTNVLYVVSSNCTENVRLCPTIWRYKYHDELPNSPVHRACQGRATAKGKMHTRRGYSQIRRIFKIPQSSGLLRSVGWLKTDVSGQMNLEKGIGCPVTSVLNQPTLRNNPDDRRIQVNRSGSLRPRLSICWFNY